jgi:hypothetical protein
MTRKVSAIRRCASSSVLLSAALLLAGELQGQDALTALLAGNAATEKLQQQQQIQDYTVKFGDFRLLAAPSVELDWNDNVNLAKEGAESDFIVRPGLQLSASYPLTEANVLAVSVGAGYNEYIEHTDLSYWYLQSGSQVAFDAAIKDFRFDLHDRFSATQDSAQESGIAGTGTYGIIQNTSGLSVLWDLEDVALSLGYDHQIVEATSSQFSYDDLNAEYLTSQAGFRLHPDLTVGVEATGSLTSYDEHILNNNDSYSVGAFGDWKPGSSFRIQPHVGYTVYLYQQTSTTIPAVNAASLYANVTASQQVTDTLSYSIAGGREDRPGIDTDLIQDWFVRPSVNWTGIKDVTIGANFSYEHGSQSQGSVPGSANYGGEVYNYLAGGINVAYQLTKRLAISMNGRFIGRSSTVSILEYTQDQVGLRLDYKFL